MLAGEVDVALAQGLPPTEADVLADFPVRVGAVEQWVAFDGTAELTTEGADAQIDRLAKKYLGKDEYPFRRPDEQRVTVRITPRRIDSSGLDE